MTQTDIVIIVCASLILIVQSFWLFLDARKRGHKYWFWAIWGLIQAPWPTICYFLFARKIFYKGKVGRNS